MKLPLQFPINWGLLVFSFTVFAYAALPSTAATAKVLDPEFPCIYLAACDVGTKV